MMKRAMVVTVLAMTGSAGASDEPPAAEKVFVPTAQVVSQHELVLTVNIEKGYALYSDRIKVTNMGGSAPLKVGVENPEKADRLRGKAVVRVRTEEPVSGTTMKAHMQGCSDAGVCYAPMVVEIANGEVKQKAESGVCGSFAIVRGLFC